MRRSLSVVVLLVAGAAAALTALSTMQGSTPAVPAVAAERRPTFSTEQDWIVSEVVAAISGIARTAGGPAADVIGVVTENAAVPSTGAPVFSVSANGQERVRVSIVNHIWAAESYAPFAARALGRRPSLDDGADHAARAPLTRFTSDALLEQGDRISAALTASITSPAAHESAALILATLALREASGGLSDVRSELSRATAHLSVARALRAAAPAGMDGALARAVVTVLAGRQREALQLVAEIDRRAVSDDDRSWVRALRFRITGDWRVPPAAAAPLLERVEYARALRAGAGDDAFLTFLDSVLESDTIEWQRIAYAGFPNVELGHTFDNGPEREVAAALLAWSRVHHDPASPRDLPNALNLRPTMSPARTVAGATRVQVLDWGRLAAFHQRHLAQSLIFRGRHLANLSDDEAQDALPAEVQKAYGRLRLYPLVARWIARTIEEYDQALLAARSLVETMPHVVTAPAWNVLLDKPWFARRAAAFPFEDRWFVPYVPAGTLYDLASRSLRPGCRRPPSIQQAKSWAAEAPFEYWTRWSAEWYAVPGKPALADLKRALGPVLDYDQNALVHLLEHIETSLDEQIATARRLCGVNPSRCDELATRLLLAGRDTDAAVTYTTWADGARDRVAVSNNLTWIVRYYLGRGQRERALTMANAAASTGSSGGLELLGHALDRTAAYSEAEQAYTTIAKRYKNDRPLGTFYLREGARRGDRSVEAQGMELLRGALPDGMERLVMHALDATPADGVAFENFGPRPAAVGLQPRDVIVGMDGWRIRSVAHYWVATRLSHDAQTTLTVWRNGSYKQLQTRMPERWLGVAIANFVPPVGTR